MPLRSNGFVVWITGLPASGKSTLARALEVELRSLGVDAATLESDSIRRVLTPAPTYSEPEREWFYETVGYIGGLLVEHGVPVIVDATGNRRAYREFTRRRVHRFLEVFVDCPLVVCLARDPKGIYRRFRHARSGRVPGVHDPYEAPVTPDLVVRGDRDDPRRAARDIVRLLSQRNWLPVAAATPAESAEDGAPISS